MFLRPLQGRRGRQVAPRSPMWLCTGKPASLGIRFTEQSSTFLSVMILRLWNHGRRYCRRRSLGRCGILLSKQLISLKCLTLLLVCLKLISLSDGPSSAFFILTLLLLRLKNVQSARCCYYLTSIPRLIYHHRYFDIFASLPRRTRVFKTVASVCQI